MRMRSCRFVSKMFGSIVGVCAYACVDLGKRIMYHCESCVRGCFEVIRKGSGKLCEIGCDRSFVDGLSGYLCLVESRPLSHVARNKRMRM